MLPLVPLVVIMSIKQYFDHVRICELEEQTKKH
jgi:hypothetical protein